MRAISLVSLGSRRHARHNALAAQLPLARRSDPSPTCSTLVHSDPLAIGCSEVSWRRVRVLRRATAAAPLAVDSVSVKDVHAGGMRPRMTEQKMFSVLTYNILDGGRHREDALHTIITQHQPDIVVMQELYDDRLLQRFARALHADWFFARSNTRYHLGLLSRFPIVKAFSYQRWPIRTALLEAMIALSGQNLHLWGVHLMPHLGVPFELWRAAEVRVVMHRTRSVQDECCLVAGDWNAIAPSDRVLVHALPPALRWVVLAQGGRTYPWAIATAQRNQWVDCYRQMHPHTPGWTLPAPQPNARLDYLFANPVLVAHLHDCSVITTPSHVQNASDHLPLLATFAYP